MEEDNRIFQGEIISLNRNTDLKQGAKYLKDEPVKSFAYKRERINRRQHSRSHLDLKSV